MRGDDLAESMATLCNIMANAVVLSKICANPNAPLPPPALMLQMSANMLWMYFGASRRDVYLASTALASLTMQTISLCMRYRAAASIPTHRRLIKPDRSNDGELTLTPLSSEKR